MGLWANLFKWRTLTKFSISIILVCLICDLWVFLFGPILKINADYIFYIFASIPTVSALSLTIITIAINSFDDKYFGYSVKEILNFKNGNIAISRVITFTLMSIIIAAFLLALNLVNSIAGLLIIVIVIIFSTTSFIWRIISDDNYCNDIVIKYMEGRIGTDNLDAQAEIVNRIFDGLSDSLDESGIVLFDDKLDLVRPILTSKHIKEKLRIEYKNRIYSLFYKVSDQVGFIPAVDKVLEIYLLTDENKDDVIKYPIFRRDLNKVKYSSVEELYKSGLVNLSNGLHNQVYLSENDKIHILYNFFIGICDNEVLPSREKGQILDETISHLTSDSYEEKDPYNHVKRMVILNIYSKCVLTNPNEKESEELLYKFSYYFHKYRFYPYDNNVGTIAIMYLAVYLYSKMEVEFIKESHRNFLREVIKYKKEGIDRKGISFIDVIKFYHDKIVTELFNIDESALKKIRFLEYYPENENGKTPVWEFENCIDFAFYNYLLLPPGNNQPFLLINGWEELGNCRIYLNRMINFFEYNELKTNYKVQLQEISKWLEMPEYYENKKSQENLFEGLNSELQICKSAELEKMPSENPGLQDINSQLVDYIRKVAIYGYDKSLKFSKSDKKIFPFVIQQKLFSFDASMIAQRYVFVFEYFLNSFLKNSTNNIKFEFNSQGVELLLDTLNSGQYTKKNFENINEFAFDEEVKESENFINLMKKIDTLEFVKTNRIGGLIIFKEDSLNWNFRISKYNHEKLISTERSNYVEQFKVAEGIYKIDGAYYDYERAIDLVEKMYVKESVEFMFDSYINVADVIMISYKY